MVVEIPLQVRLAVLGPDEWWWCEAVRGSGEKRAATTGRFEKGVGVLRFLDDFRDVKHVPEYSTVKVNEYIAAMFLAGDGVLLHFMKQLFGDLSRRRELGWKEELDPWGRANVADQIVEEFHKRARAKVRELWTAARVAEQPLQEVNNG